MLSLEGFAVDVNGPSQVRTATVYVTVERWSTQSEIERLHHLLAARGGDALLSGLQKVKPRVGYLRTDKSLSWDIYYAREVPAEDGGRRIYIATDRPIGNWEASQQGRSVDYAFTLMEIHLGKDGKGDGRIAPAAKITYKKDARGLEIEDYQVAPVRLSEVHILSRREAQS
jgi:hypothetical protein